MTDEDDEKGIEEADDEDDDEEEDEPVRPAPVKLSRKDLAPLIVRRFAIGWNAFQIHKWLKKMNIADAETGEFLAPRQIGGFRSLLRQRRRHPKTPPPDPPQAPPVAPPVAPRPINTGDSAITLRFIARFAKATAANDDPVLKMRALFHVGDEEDRKGCLFTSRIGRERLMRAARRLIQEHEELRRDFGVYVLACESPDGRAWMDKALLELEIQAKLAGIRLEGEEAEEMLDDFETNLGFHIQ